MKQIDTKNRSKHECMNSLGWIQKKPLTTSNIPANDSMSDIFSESDFESEVGYASCEKDDSATSDAGRYRQVNKARKKRHRKHRLDQLKKYEIYSNDSDTTFDGTGNCSRKQKVSRKLRETPEDSDTSLIAQKALSNRDCSPKNTRRPRNGSKASWTDSGVSMSKTDSQPSTLGDRSHGARLMSKRHAAGDVAPLDAREDSPVELLRGEINRRSRSTSDYLKQAKNQRQNECKSAPPRTAEAVDSAGDAAKEADKEAAQEEHRIRRQGSLRHPEIIKKNSFRRKPDDPHRAEKTLDDPVQSDVSIECEGLSKMENEIIKQLVENAREADQKESIPSSPSSCHSKDDAASIKKSRFQRIKAVLRTMKPRLHSASKSTSQHIDCNGRCQSPLDLDSYLSDDVSIQSRCIDESCCCDCDEILRRDHLSHLGRTIPAKKRNFLARIFRSSSKPHIDITAPSSRVYRSGSHGETDFGRKRSGSTRSLPESLRFLWLKAVSKSTDNITTQRFANQFLRKDSSHTQDFDCRRSRSSCSLIKPPYYPHFPIISSKSCEALSLQDHVIRSPPTPVRRTASLRSLNITKNYDIATHVLQARGPPMQHAENNNLFYHPYFEGHAAKEDFIKGADQKDSLQCHCCTKEKLLSPRGSRKYDGAFDFIPQVIPITIPTRSSEIGNESRDQYSLENWFPCKHGHNNNNGLGMANYCCDVTSMHFGCRDNECGGNDDDDDDDDEGMIVAPLKVTVTEEKLAEKVRLKTSKTIDTFV